MLLRVAICDDDMNIAKSLKQMIMNEIELETGVIDVFTSADEMAFHAEDKAYDVILMDIELGEESGIALSKAIKAKYPQAQIIFISGFDDYYLDVYDVEHVYFLRKPITSEKLQAALDFACKNIADNVDSFLTINNRKSIDRVPLGTITYLEKSKRLIIIHTIDGREFQTYGKLSDLTEALPESFIQCHYSFVVNMKYINSISEKKITVADQFEIPISKSRHAQTMDAFFAYID